jgi:dTDP-4-dehydrorhamnose 3,5-epimerase
MKITPTAIKDVLLLSPVVRADERGFFLETYRREVLEKAAGTTIEFVQENHSRSRYGVLRGLHFQLPPHAQGKLVRCSRGSIFDVAVDLRLGSPTRGRWVGETLSEENFRELWIPPGLAHGFLVLTEIAEMQYKLTDYYVPEADRCLRWNDPTVAIKWPSLGIAPLTSAKDGNAPELQHVLAELDRT